MPLAETELLITGAGGFTVKVSVAVPVPLVEQTTTLEFAGGLTFMRDQKLSLYIQAGYHFGIAPKLVHERGIKGDVGLRYTW